MNSKAFWAMLARILAIKQKITEKINDFILQVKKNWEYNDRVVEFDINNERWNAYGSMQKIRWLLVLFLVIPVLILVDFASLKLFIEYLEYSANSVIISNIIKAIGIIIFFVLELAVCFAILRINEKIPSLSLKFLKIVLTLVMVTLPSLLIYTGYLLLPSPNPGDWMKTFSLILLSLAVHMALFILINDILQVIAYLSFIIRKWLLQEKNPTKYLEKIKRELLQLNNQYKIETVRFLEFPDAGIYASSVKLSPKEQSILDRLDDGLDEDDYDEFVNMKSHYPPKTPIASSGSSSSSTIW
jgi:hypothetical protein